MGKNVKIDGQIIQNCHVIKAFDADSGELIEFSTSGPKVAEIADGSIREINKEDLAGVTKIAPYAFYGCRNLEIISLPNGLKEIGSYAFYRTGSNLRELTLNDDLEIIGNSAFQISSSMGYGS